MSVAGDRFLISRSQELVGERCEMQEMEACLLWVSTAGPGGVVGAAARSCLPVAQETTLSLPPLSLIPTMGLSQFLETLGGHEKWLSPQLSSSARGSRVRWDGESGHWVENEN